MIPSTTARPIFSKSPAGLRFIADHLLESVAEFMDGKRADGEMPLRPPKGLGELIYSLDPKERAAVALVPLLDCIWRGWDGDDTESAEMLLAKKIGGCLRDKLAMKGLLDSDDKHTRSAGRRLAKGGKRSKRDWAYLKYDWPVEECVRAGRWLMLCVLCFEFFPLDERGFPTISEEFLDYFQATRQQFLVLGRDFLPLPHESPPPDWTAWRAQYDKPDSGMAANFVRDWRSGTRAAITAAFEKPFEHADSVNNLQRVAFTLDPLMVELADRFAVELMNHEGDRRNRDRNLVKTDIDTARIVGGKPFWLSYNCDKRGRLYALPHLNYLREGHVKAMFRFANGLPLGGDDIQWLEINAANCAGEDKVSLAGRIRWAKDNRETIRAIAADPFKTLHAWRDADKPFRYVAACRELAAAWQDPESFVTHLPICFDGSCNGVQHLALLSRDEDAGRRVNLLPGEEPRDIYGDIAARVVKMVLADDDNRAQGWREFFETVDAKQIRKLIKQPAMTFAYSVTDSGMRDQIKEEYSEIARGRNATPPSAYYLALKIRRAAEGLLRGPAKTKACLSQLTKHHADAGRILEWQGPTGFPVSNDYRAPNVRTIAFYEGLVCVKSHDIADGCLEKINVTKACNSVSPNFVHSMDAAHLAKVVNRAFAEGITSIVTVHDAYGCLAPQAQRFRKIITSELAALYADDHLADIVGRNLPYVHEDVRARVELPTYGKLDPAQIADSEYPFS